MGSMDHCLSWGELKMVMIAWGNNKGCDLCGSAHNSVGTVLNGWCKANVDSAGGGVWHNMYTGSAGV
jgi:hypothetical protein